MDPDAALACRRALGRWYSVHGRHALPWRQTRDPYAVLVSEVMLQQTGVGRVLGAFERWLARWPSAAALAEASAADVIRAWAGMGYNRRALQLHAAARAIVARGSVPGTVEGLRSLPGVGPYTAAAVASFARGAHVAVVDTNVGRVLARAVLGLPVAAGATTVASAAEAFLPARDVRHHNLALMDLGALVCRARAPSCASCPIGPWCAWQAAGAPPAPVRTRTTPAFATTARFARGQLVAALRRAGPLSEGALGEALPEAHRPRLEAYLAALAGDGLAVRCDAGWALPGEPAPQGKRSMASPKL
ncbi:MAG: A/G-specific adenine glycosylase [Dehalococcoidia bacterium]|nr:A/G-specific adenine glycosylase [Dehalococcoidia bacterium]